MAFVRNIVVPMPPRTPTASETGIPAPSASESSRPAASTSNGGTFRGYEWTSIDTVVIMGAGYLGSVLAAHLVEHHDVDVIVFDLDHEKINDWNSGRIPIHEPMLAYTIDRHRHFLPPRTLGARSESEHNPSPQLLTAGEPRSGSLTFATGFGVLRKAQVIFVCVWVDVAKAIQQIVKNCTQDIIIVVHSTMQLNDLKQFDEWTSKGAHRHTEHDILVVPLFSSAGKALRDLEMQRHVFIGAKQNERGDYAAQTIKKFFARFYSHLDIFITDWKTAQLAKLTTNAFLAQQISSLNIIADICATNAADFELVKRAMEGHPHIGKLPFHESGSFGGSCLLKDLNYFVGAASEVSTNYGYWFQTIHRVNFSHMLELERRIFQCVRSLNPSSARIALIGVAFKCHTDDVRSSLTLTLLKRLLEIPMELEIKLYDPYVSKEKLAPPDCIPAGRLRPELTAEGLRNLRTTCEGADLIVVMTACVDTESQLTSNNDANSPSWAIIKEVVRTPIIYDTLNTLNRKYLMGLGFTVHGTGRALSDTR